MTKFLNYYKKKKQKIFFKELESTQKENYKQLKEINKMLNDI